MDPIHRATVIYGGFSQMLKEIKQTEGSAHSYIASFKPLIDAGITELSGATAIQFNGGELPAVLGPQVPDDLYERIQVTGSRCALLADRREEFGPGHPEVTMWAGLVRDSIDEIATEMVALLAPPGAVGEASE